jgi:hypothetical protein
MQETVSFWNLPTIHYHRPLSVYFGALESAGFVVDALREPVPSDKLMEERPDWEYHCRVPSFLVVRSLKRQVV